MCMKHWSPTVLIPKHLVTEKRCHSQALCPVSWCSCSYWFSGLITDTEKEYKQYTKECRLRTAGGRSSQGLLTRKKKRKQKRILRWFIFHCLKKTVEIMKTMKCQCVWCHNVTSVSFLQKQRRNCCDVFFLSAWSTLHKQNESSTIKLTPQPLSRPH